MSRLAFRAKLKIAMSVELHLRFEPHADPPAGWVRDRDGRSFPFNGWLGLMRVLEDHSPTGAPAQTPSTPPGGPMATATGRAVDPIALQHDEGEALWFLGVLATIKASTETTNGGVAVIEHLAPRGAGSPLHVHRREDEWFYVTEGELTFWVGGQVIAAPAGSFVYGPRDIPHTFAVSSEQARFLLVTEPAGFEAFMRQVGEPAQALTTPPPPSEPPDPARLAAIAAEYGIEILGPPGIPA